MTDDVPAIVSLLAACGPPSDGLIARVVEVAHEHGVHAVSALTTTAADFFARPLGFRPTVRTAVPAAMQQCGEFISTRPATAQVMVREISR